MKCGAKYALLAKCILRLYFMEGGAMKCGAGMLCLQSMIAALLHGLLCIRLY